MGQSNLSRRQVQNIGCLSAAIVLADRGDKRVPFVGLFVLSYAHSRDENLIFPIFKDRVMRLNADLGKLQLNLPTLKVK